MPAYLALAQVAALAAFLPRAPGGRLLRDVLVIQSVLLAGFYLVWGGHSTDAWSYLTGFDGSPFVYEKEWLFYCLGYALNKVVPDPWPLRLISAACVLLLVISVVSHFGVERRRDAVIALFVLAILPAFFTAFGNTVRQGLAASILVFALVRSTDDRYGWLIVAAVAGWFVHQPSIALFAAIGMSFLRWRTLAIALLFAPAASFVASGIAESVGIDLRDHLPYGGKSEGAFHWAKFAVAYSAAWISLWTSMRCPPRDSVLLRSFVSMVAIAACLVRFEVPFERLLSYAEVLAPFVVPAVLARLGRADRWMRFFWAPGVAAGLVIWTHESIRSTLGFA